jgi:hypothetical protein
MLIIENPELMTRKQVGLAVEFSYPADCMLEIDLVTNNGPGQRVANSFIVAYAESAVARHQRRCGRAVGNPELTVLPSSVVAKSPLHK